MTSSGVLFTLCIEMKFFLLNMFYYYLRIFTQDCLFSTSQNVINKMLTPKSIHSTTALQAFSMLTLLKKIISYPRICEEIISKDHIVN